jgi:rod shape determining protein RodA
VVLGERFGLFGWCVLLGLYLFLAWRTLAIAQQTREPFGRLAAIGIAALMATQVIVNTAMLVGLLPITGLALPLVSYGGSSLLASALSLGLVLNIALRPGYEVTNEPFRFTD